MTTGLVWHERYMWHDTSANGAGPLRAGGWVEPGAPMETPATKRRFKNLLDISGLTERLTAIAPRQATAEELGRVHAEAHVARIRTESASVVGGDGGDGSTPFGPGGFEILALAAGGAIAAVEAVLDGVVDNCYALVRPPGHHATRTQGMGLCVFNNTGVAARNAQATRGIERVAIVDIDVHHGNGTQAIFYDDPTVLTVSVHQDNTYPLGSGSIEERGDGPGEGANVNVPLPPGSGVGAYRAAFERVVLPALDAFTPQLVLVGCGLDANAMDPDARQMLYSDAYRELTAMLMQAADRHADGRIAFVHEGGYSEVVVPFCGLAVVETLSGLRTEVEDPFLPALAGMGGQELQPHQAAAVDAAARAAGLAATSNASR